MLGPPNATGRMVRRLHRQRQARINPLARFIAFLPLTRRDLRRLTLEALQRVPEQIHRINFPGRLTAPPVSTNLTPCTIDFDDPVSLSAIPDVAKYTFAFWPHYNVWCNQDTVGHVVPIAQNHYHLSFENASTSDCLPLFDTPACQALDLTQEPRYVNPHTSQAWVAIGLSALDDDDPTTPHGSPKPFVLRSFRVWNSTTTVCYLPVGAGTGPWLTTGGSGDELPGPGWRCWTDLPPGHWDVSAHATNVIEVRISGGGDGIFSLDDIVVEH